MRAKRDGPSLTHRPYPTANPTISIASVPPAAVGPESREADGYPSFLEKRDRRERSFFIEKAHSARRFSPQGHRVHAPCPNKRRKDCVCHRVSNIEDTDPHTILNVLLVLAMIERKLYTYQNARVTTLQCG